MRTATGSTGAGLVGEASCVMPEHAEPVRRYQVDIDGPSPDPAVGERHQGELDGIPTAGLTAWQHLLATTPIGGDNGPHTADQGAV